MIKQLVAGECLLQAQHALLIAGPDHLVHDGGSGGKVGLHAVLAGGQPDAANRVGLARTAGTEGDDVLPPGDELARCKVVHERLVQAGDGVEVGALEALERREAGVADASLDGARLAIEQLQFDQPRQIAHMVDVLGGLLPGYLLVFAQLGRQLQLLEVVAQEDIEGLGGGRGGHLDAPALVSASRLM